MPHVYCPARTRRKCMGVLMAVWPRLPSWKLTDHNRVAGASASSVALAKLKGPFKGMIEAGAARLPVQLRCSNDANSLRVGMRQSV